MGWRATKRCPGSASERSEETLSVLFLAGAGSTLYLSAARLRNFTPKTKPLSADEIVTIRPQCDRHSSEFAMTLVWKEVPVNLGNARMWKTKGTPPLRCRRFHE
jgi:hypothetical protein